MSIHKTPVHIPPGVIVKFRPENYDGTNHAYGTVLAVENNTLKVRVTRRRWFGLIRDDQETRVRVNPMLSFYHTSDTVRIWLRHQTGASFTLTQLKDPDWVREAIRAFEADFSNVELTVTLRDVSGCAKPVTEVSARHAGDDVDDILGSVRRRLRELDREIKQGRLPANIRIP